MTIYRDIPLRPPKAPNLLVAPVDYRQQYIDQLNNALRLYFNQIDNSIASLLDVTGGGALSLPHIAASDSTDQYATANNDPTVVAFNTLDFGLGFNLQAPGTAIAQVSGTYKITYSAQLVNTDNAIHTATFWLKVNNSDVINSATIFSIPARKSALVPSYVAGYSEVTFAVEAGDEIELYWATEKAYSTTGPIDGVYIFHDVAQTVPYVRPAVPSVIGSITFVSRLP
jgi:hypothetical protein